MNQALSLTPACRKPSPDRHVLALEEVRLRGVERALILGCGLILAGFLVWAQFTALPEIASAPGEVSTTIAAAPVQHLEGGIVAEVLVREGDVVTEGQPLMRMHDAAARAELGQLMIRHTVLRLQAQRLQAVVEGNLAPIGEASQLSGPQNLALASRLTALTDRLGTATEQAAQRGSDIRMLEAQARGLETQILLFQDEFETRRGLARQGLTTRTNVLDAQRQLLAAQSDHQRLLGQAATARLALGEAEARITEIRSTAHDEARQEAARVAQEIAETDETIARMRDRSERTILRAPGAGILRGLSVHRPGSVVQPGAVLGEILPQNTGLAVDVRISPRDIGFVTVGQTVQVKVQSFDYARFGTVEGRVERISAGAFLDEQRQPHYRVRVALTQGHVGADPRQARLVPGMTVQAEITTGQKTVMQYLLKPLYAVASTAFQER